MFKFAHQFCVLMPLKGYHTLYVMRGKKFSKLKNIHCLEVELFFPYRVCMILFFINLIAVLIFEEKSSSSNRKYYDNQAGILNVNLHKDK